MGKLFFQLQLHHNKCIIHAIGLLTYGYDYMHSIVQHLIVESITIAAAAAFVRYLKCQSSAKLLLQPG